MMMTMCLIFERASSKAGEAALGDEDEPSPGAVIRENKAGAGVRSLAKLAGLLFMDELQPTRRKARRSVMKMRIGHCSLPMIYPGYYRAKKPGFQEKELRDGIRQPGLNSSHGFNQAFPASSQLKGILCSGGGPEIFTRIPFRLHTFFTIGRYTKGRLTMRLFSFHPRVETKYIRLHRRMCQACGECVKVCPVDVLQLRRGHRHVILKNPQACNGCKKCVQVCEHAALEYTYTPRSRLSQPQVQ
jgi:ferredoxin